MISIHEMPVVWDNHGCMPLRPDDSFLPQLERYRNSGCTVVSLNIGYSNIPAIDQLRTLSFMRHWIAMRPDKYRLIGKVDDIEQCRIDDQLGITFDIEGMDPIIEQPSFVQSFYELGVRWMLIAYNRRNAAGGGCLDETDEGLSNVGRQIIDEMERVGMVLCLSHAGRRTAQEALEYSTNPTIFSHSNPKGDHNHPRNVDDALIEACASGGGVIGVSGIGRFLGQQKDVIEDIVRQIRYLVDLVGDQHVGLGLDYVFDLSELETQLNASPGLFAPGSSLVDRKVVGPEDLSKIALALSKAGYSDHSISNIFGQNWMRVASTVWK
jgi:membrane dipeptidase